MNEKYAIFMDIDGTLATDFGISQGHMDAVKQVQALGHKVFANTGRALSIVQHEVRYEMNLDGIIAGNGAYISCGDEVWLNQAIDMDVLASVIDRFNGNGTLCVLEGPERSMYINNPGNPININSSDELMEKYSDLKISKITFGSTLNAELIAFLEQYFDVFIHPGYSEIAIKGCGKAEAMELVAKRLGIDMAHTMAIGDSANDVVMLKRAGISVAMGNALDSVKELCDYVTLPVDEDGIAHAFKHFFGI